MSCSQIVLFRSTGKNPCHRIGKKPSDQRADRYNGTGRTIETIGETIGKKGWDYRCEAATYIGSSAKLRWRLTEGTNRS